MLLQKHYYSKNAIICTCFWIKHVLVSACYYVKHAVIRNMLFNCSNNFINEMKVLSILTLFNYTVAII